MKSIAHNVMISLIILFTTAVQAATEINPGVLYSEGAQLGASDLGVEFTVPAGWQALLPQGAEVMMMEPANAVARIIISAVTESNEASIRQILLQNQPLDATSQLVALGPVQRDGDLYLQNYSMQGQNPQNLAARGYARLGSNRTAFFALILEPKGKEQFTDLARDFVKSVQFKKIAAPQAAQAENINWEQDLTGRTLKYMKTSNGLSVTKTISLCSNHKFIYSDSDNYASSNAYTDFSAATHSGQSGDWDLEGNRLQLQWSDGSRSQFTLSRRYVEEWGEWGTFVDNERWFNVRNEACR